jgi:hypothetical protein
MEVSDDGIWHEGIYEKNNFGIKIDFKIALMYGRVNKKS